jgi:hypothetical protein
VDFHIQQPFDMLHFIEGYRLNQRPPAWLYALT